jgi:hypothetical protein
MNNPEMLGWLDAMPRVKYRVGESKTKVQACNDGLAEERFDIVLLASDDMAPQRDDYASRIVSLFAEHFPEGDGVLHLNDGRVGRKLATICCCDRKYFSRRGHLYHPSFTSVWCDNEWQEVAESLGRLVYVDDVLIRHEWVGEHCPDALHKRNESFSNADCRTFRHRKLAGFPT